MSNVSKFRVGLVVLLFFSYLTILFFKVNDELKQETIITKDDTVNRLNDFKSKYEEAVNTLSLKASAFSIEEDEIEEVPQEIGFEVEDDVEQDVEEVTEFNTLDEVSDYNSKLIYSYLKSKGISDIMISGVLGHFERESRLDPTSIEGYYHGGPTKRFIDNILGTSKNDFEFGKSGVQKKTILNQLDKATRNCINSYSFSINQSGYIAEDGKYYAGIGIGAYTGNGARNLLNLAKRIGEDPLTLEFQLAYEAINKNAMISEDETFYDNTINILKQTKVNSPREAALFLLNHHGYKGTEFNEFSPAPLAVNKRISNANDFYNQITTNKKEWVVNDAFNSRVDRIIAKAK